MAEVPGPMGPDLFPEDILALRIILDFDIPAQVNLLDNEFNTLTIRDVISSIIRRLFPNEAALMGEYTNNLQDKLPTVDFNDTFAWVVELDLDLKRKFTQILREFLKVDRKIGKKKFLIPANKIAWNRTKEAMLYLQIIKLLPPKEDLPPDKSIELEQAELMHADIQNYINPQAGGAAGVGPPAAPPPAGPGLPFCRLGDEDLSDNLKVYNFIIRYYNYWNGLDYTILSKNIITFFYDIEFKLRKSVNNTNDFIISNFIFNIYLFLKYMTYLYTHNTLPEIKTQIIGSLFEFINDFANNSVRLYDGAIKITIPPPPLHGGASQPIPLSTPVASTIESSGESVASPLIVGLVQTLEPGTAPTQTAPTQSASSAASHVDVLEDSSESATIADEFIRELNLAPQSPSATASVVYVSDESDAGDGARELIGQLNLIHPAPAPLLALSLVSTPAPSQAPSPVPSSVRSSVRSSGSVPEEQSAPSSSGSAPSSVPVPVPVEESQEERTQVPRMHRKPTPHDDNIYEEISKPSDYLTQKIINIIYKLKKKTPDRYKNNFKNIIIDIMRLILLTRNRKNFVGGSDIFKTQPDILIKYFKYKKKYLLLKNKIFKI